MCNNRTWQTIYASSMECNFITKWQGIYVSYLLCNSRTWQGNLLAIRSLILLRFDYPTIRHIIIRLATISIAVQSFMTSINNLSKLTPYSANILQKGTGNFKLLPTNCIVTLKYVMYQIGLVSAMVYFTCFISSKEMTVIWKKYQPFRSL